MVSFESWNKARALRSWALMEPWEYEKALEETYPHLISGTGIEGFNSLCDLLDSAFTGAYSWAYRSTIEPSEQNISSHTSVGDTLIDAVRNAAARMVDENPPIADEILTALLRRQNVLFRRTAIDLLVTHSDLLRSQAIEAALNTANLAEVALFHEYSHLVRSVFAFLPRDKQDQFLSWVDSGSTSSDMQDPEEREVARTAWRSRWLTVLKDALPGELKEEYQKLAAAKRVPEHPDLLSYSSVSMGPTSPKSDDDLSKMAVADIVDFLRSWTQSSSWDAPTPEGLGRALQRTVSKDPTRFVDALEEFQTSARPMRGRSCRVSKRLLKLVYLLTGLGAMGFLSQVISIPREIGEKPRHLDADPHWGWARKAVASLLRTLLGKDLLALSLRTVIWELLARLTRDPDPTPKDDAETSMDPATYSINTTRGEAMHAVIQYALWIHRGERRQANGAVATFEDMPEVRDLLEFHINDPSPAIRSVYGQYLPWLTLLDRDWVGSSLEGFCREKRNSTH